MNAIGNIPLDLTQSVRPYSRAAIAAGRAEMMSHGISSQAASATVAIMAAQLEHGQTVQALRTGQVYLSTDAVYSVFRAMMDAMPAADATRLLAEQLYIAATSEVPQDRATALVKACEYYEQADVASAERYVRSCLVAQKLAAVKAKAKASGFTFSVQSGTRGSDGHEVFTVSLGNGGAPHFYGVDLMDVLEACEVAFEVAA